MRTADERAERRGYLLGMDTIGSTVWVIAEGYIPSASHGPEPEMTSHETACILNPCSEDAAVEITLYFSQRFNDLQEPEPVPRGTEYASVIRSSVSVVVQHSRLDSRQAENALLTTIAYPAQ